jgi:hypothetical protein
VWLGWQAGPSMGRASVLSHFRLFPSPSPLDAVGRYADGETREAEMSAHVRFDVDVQGPTCQCHRSEPTQRLDKDKRIDERAAQKQRYATKA